MNVAVENLKPVLAALDTGARLLVRQYLDELDHQQNAESPDDEDDPEFVAEINRRVESIRNGTAKTIPADEVFQRIDAKLKAMRESTP